MNNTGRGDTVRVAQVVTAATSLRLMRGWLRALSRAGYEVHTICSPGAELPGLLEHEEVARSHVLAMSRATSPLRDLVSLCRLVALLRRERFDVVHASTPKAGLLGMLAAWLVRTPVRIYTCRGLRLSGQRGLGQRLLWVTEWLSMRLATDRLAVSESVAREAVRLGVCAAGCIQVLHHGSSNGVDSDVFRRLRSSAEARLRLDLGLTQGQVVVGFVGRLVPDKGIVELEQAWRAIRARAPGARLLLVGGTEPHAPLPDGVFERLAEDSTVALAGWREDTAACFEAMDLLVLPTYREGFSNVLLEAGAMGLPVVATRVIGSVDAVVDEGTGLLVPLGDVDALTEAVVRLIADEELRRRLGSAGRALTQRDFRPADVWSALLRVYRDALQSRGLVAPAVRAR